MTAPGWRFAAAFMWVLTVFFCPLAGAQANEGQHKLPVLTSHIMLTQQTAIPADTQAWVAQPLPDNWSLSRPGIGGFAWYRIGLELDASQLQLSGLYVPRLSMNGVAYINGEFIGGDGKFDEPTGRQWYRPQLFQIPAGLLKLGHNVIHIRIKAYPSNRGGLSQVYFGPAAAIRTQWEDRWFWQVTSVQITTAITLGLSVLAFIAWSMNGFGSAYGYFGAGALIWGLRNLHFLVVDIPIPAALWEVLVATSLMWVLVLVSVFEVRFANRSYPKSERFLWVYCASVPFIVWAAGVQHLALAITGCYAVLLAMGAFILLLLLDEVRRKPNAHTMLSLGASLVVYALATHDFVMQSDALGFGEPYQLHYGAPIMFSVVALNMIQRFRQSKASAEELALNLETRVQQKNAELQQSYHALRQAEAHQAKAQERGRIMQDMHDGLGSQLVSSLALAQTGDLTPGQTYALLRSCIDDLRLAIDSSGESGESLALALGNLRFRMEPRLRAAGLQLRWDTTALDENQPVLPEAQLSILRIIQESITNTLKHAKAKVLTINVGHLDGNLQVTISDDGQGYDVVEALQNPHGKGLNGLHKRARALGAALDIQSSPAGTRTRLTLPG